MRFLPNFTISCAIELRHHGHKENLVTMGVTWFHCVDCGDESWVGQRGKKARGGNWVGAKGFAS